MGLARSEEPVPDSIPHIPMAQLRQEPQGSNGEASPFSRCQERSSAVKYVLCAMGIRSCPGGGRTRERQGGIGGWGAGAGEGEEKVRRRQWKKEERVRLAAPNKCCQ